MPLNEVKLFLFLSPEKVSGSFFKLVMFINIAQMNSLITECSLYSLLGQAMLPEFVLIPVNIESCPVGKYFVRAKPNPGGIDPRPLFNI